jgi:hypothetical protein
MKREGCLIKMDKVWFRFNVAKSFACHCIKEALKGGNKMETLRIFGDKEKEETKAAFDEYMKPSGVWERSVALYPSKDIKCLNYDLSWGDDSYKYFIHEEDGQHWLLRNINK